MCFWRDTIFAAANSFRHKFWADGFPSRVWVSFGFAAHKFDRLTVFVFLWASVRFFHQVSFPEWAIHHDKWGYLLMAAVVLALVRPQSVWVLVLLLVASMLRTLHWMPFNPNHILFEFYVDGGILFSLMYGLGAAYWQKGDKENPVSREKIFEGFAPMARISIILLYFYAVFHKLNWDYFNPEISCGTFLMRGLLEHFHLTYFPYWGKLLAVWGTLAIELLIPVFFLFRPTRRWGILLGLVFHFVLSLHPHLGLYSFSALLVGFFYLFTPPGFNDALAAQAARWRGRFSKIPYQVAGVSVLAAILFLWLHQYRHGGFVQAAFVLWYVWWAFVFVVYWRFFVGHPPGERSFRDTFAPHPRVMWVFVLVVFVNGLSPYLGLKTQTSYSMFSNLRTEGGMTNHIFMPRNLLATRWQDDLVTIVRTDAPALRGFSDGKRMITYFEFRRAASETHHDFFVDYRRAGKQRHLEVRNGTSNDPGLTRPYPWPVRKIMRFRPVYADTCRCQH